MSWRRTVAVRRGRIVPGRVAADRRPASATTWLAAAASAAVAAGGALLPVGGVVRWVAVAGAALVAADGVAERVTAVGLSPGDLGIGRALVPDQRVPWAGIRELRPPSTPLSRWRIRSAAGEISLMPSDLFGGEDALGEIVRRSELEFRNGRWQRSPEAGERRPGERPAG